MMLRWPVVDLGTVLVTTGVLETLDEAWVAELLARHQGGDWGDVGAEDGHLNDMALRNGGRLFSAYDTEAGRVWIITEGDRSATTVLLPSEY
jgi:hypothetical protein